ncbi:hypothetical protein PVAG01_09111 [Phlyctema vagabunda]|uniref:Methyltransferase domain-containing protein n=1 Tax=Phlyctema vagabunda TaxID=108571 RepID=A0ABR4P6F4_9HELO
MPARPVQSVSNTELYDRWAEVYDTDGNILQSIDDQLLPALLTEAFSQRPADEKISLTELGCGTGRNTSKLVQAPYTSQIRSVTALDLSAAMLEIAAANVAAANQSSREDGRGTSVRFVQYDALHPSLEPETAELVLSTLVLEHLPLDVFFKTVRSFLNPNPRFGGGLVVLTNMHADMGRQSQAGFVDIQTGEKIRGTSFVYEIHEVVQEAERWGFEVVGDVQERMVHEEDVASGVVGERGRKWVGVNVWFGCILRLQGL